MGATRYNGVLLPDLPTLPYPHALILDIRNVSVYEVDADYVLCVCDQPFKASLLQLNAFSHSSEANIKAYIPNMTAYRWEEATVVQSGTGDYASVYGSLVWSNNNLNVQNAHPGDYPTWDRAAYPYFLMIGRPLGVSASSDFTIPEFELYYSAQPFIWNDLGLNEDGSLNVNDPGFFNWSTNVVGHWRYFATGDFFNTKGWKTGSGGEFISGLPEKLVTGPYYNPQSDIFFENAYANHNIVGALGLHEIKANSWYELLAYEAGTTEDVPVPEPTNIVVTGGGAYTQGDTAGQLTCTANAPEGGKLFYYWYRNGSYFTLGDSITPTTNAVGTFNYYCEVANSMYGESVRVRSETITVTVKAKQAIQELSKDAYMIGYVLNLCGVPCAETIAYMIANGASTKEIVAYMFGEAKLPPVHPVYDAYPYWRLKDISGTYFLEGFKTKPVTEYQSGLFKNCDFNGLATAEEYMSSTVSGADWYDSVGSASNQWAKLASIVWANYPIYTSEGELYMAAMEPTPVYKGAMCSYNGTTLAELPEWDTATYPYCMIVLNGTDIALYCYSAMPTTNSNGNCGSFTGDGVSRTTCYSNKDGTCWWMFSGDSTIAANASLGDIIWANFPVKNPDGSVYMPASDPIPL